MGVLNSMMAKKLCLGNNGNNLNEPLILNIGLIALCL